MRSGVQLSLDLGWRGRGHTVEAITASRSLDANPSRTRVRTLPRIFCSVVTLGGELLALVIRNAAPAFEIASEIEVGVAVGLIAWKSFCTTTGTSAPRSVPFLIASVVQSASKF